RFYMLTEKFNWLQKYDMARFQVAIQIRCSVGNAHVNNRLHIFQELQISPFLEGTICRALYPIASPAANTIPQFTIRSFFIGMQRSNKMLIEKTCSPLNGRLVR